MSSEVHLMKQIFGLPGKIRNLLSSKNSRTKFIFKVGNLLSGLVLTNIINFVGFLIIAKLFHVETLGQYYIFIAIATVMNIVITVGYPQSIPLLKNEELRDMYLSILLLASLLICIASPFIFLVYDQALFLILYGFAQACLSISQQVFIRDQLVYNINIMNGLNSVGNIFFILMGFHLYGNSLYHLILMTTLSVILVNIMIYVAFLKDYKFFQFYKFNINILWKYNNFSKYIGPGLILHTVAYQIPTLAAGYFFSPSIAAYYNMAYKLVYLPATLISSSISQVFVGRLSQKSRQNEGIFFGFTELSKYLILISTIFMTSLWIIVPKIIIVFFDDSWMGAIQISYALLPLAFALIAISPLSAVLQFTNNQLTILKLHTYSLLISILSFGLGIFLNNFIIGVYIFSIAMLIRYLGVLASLIKIRKRTIVDH